ncbi:YafY family protein [Kitasatospora sp. YST-16]|uniref:helix-turn-helix transcriptional regulator n=1 Tax=Kitasatospora sp. YST-16 TaxID=2998080 RepID=UPI002284913E|nr:YafY family protein [Kitasatospora sp. YST-16]WAL71518.1 YafY family protein [Kitasatospora sp. YST-16]WNW37558.1 YafY family protein [Streptomyces sp. Li-HN-5-13]
MTRPLARVLALLELLQSGGVRTVAELAERLEVDERTVRRYVAHLVDLDLPVESVRGRYGGYRLAPGHRMPPLMLTDEEALAALFGLAAAQRAGLSAASATAGETAAAKIRRVLPPRLAHRLDALLSTLAFTAAPAAASSAAAASAAVPDPEALLTVADAVRHRRPLAFRYTSADRRTGDPTGDATDDAATGSRTRERTVRPYGLVLHAGRWYLTGWDTGADAERLFRLDRLAAPRPLPGTFEPPAGPDPAERVLHALATAPHRHRVRLRIRADAARIRAQLPAGLALVGEPDADGWSDVELRVAELDWLPGVLAALDRPFTIVEPEQLRSLVAALAERLAAAARPH